MEGLNQQINNMFSEQSKTVTPPTSLEAKFRQRKDGIEYGEIDSGIRELCRELNNMPFVLTLASCEGHLLDEGGDGMLYGMFPDEGCVFVTYGDLIFGLDEGDERGRTFLANIKQLVEKYPFADIYKHHCEEEDCPIQDSWAIGLDQNDLTHAEQIEDSDSLEEMNKKRFQVKADLGVERVKEYHQFWEELSDLTSTYKFTD